VRKRGANYFRAAIRKLRAFKSCVERGKWKSMTTRSRVVVQFVAEQALLVIKNLLLLCFGALKIPSKNLNCLFPARWRRRQMRAYRRMVFADDVFLIKLEHKKMLQWRI
jgi:uncharacterized membrane protein